MTFQKVQAHTLKPGDRISTVYHERPSMRVSEVLFDGEALHLKFLNHCTTKVSPTMVFNRYEGRHRSLKVLGVVLLVSVAALSSWLLLLAVAKSQE